MAVARTAAASIVLSGLYAFNLAITGNGPPGGVEITLSVAVVVLTGLPG